MTSHENKPLRHAVVFRTIEVSHVETLTPHMRRVVFAGPALHGFLSAAPDDHVKLFFPNRAGQIVQPAMGPNGLEYPEGIEHSPMRDYTPRRFEADSSTLTIDFVLHGDGPASSWAAQAAPGQRIGAGGPRGSLMIADDFDTYVLVGDETALPAIGRWLEEMPEGAHAEVFVEIPGRDDRQALSSRASFNLTWLEREGADAASSDLLEKALQDFHAPQGDSFYWIAAESRRARNMRLFLAGERGVPKAWLKATGYWKHDDADPD
jgi:NADPH-dependent ferric siderophore reductase